MAGCIIKCKIAWSSQEIHRTLYEEVINHFLKVNNSLSLYFVTSCVKVSFGIRLLPKGKTLCGIVGRKINNY